MKTIAITAVLALFCTTARADDIEVDEDDISFYGDSELYEQVEEYDETIPEWGYSQLEWIWTPDPGSCTAEQCTGYCDIYVYACVDGNCQGWIDWDRCWRVTCGEIETCA